MKHKLLTGDVYKRQYNTLEYHSLKDEVKDFTFHNDEIWNIVCVQGEIVFQSFGSLFFYNEYGQNNRILRKSLHKFFHLY